jgi:Flp pilus assembly protein TadG
MCNGLRRRTILAFTTGVLAVFGPKKCLSANSLSFGLVSLWKDQRGAIAIMTGLSATVLVGFAALAIDVGSWQVARRSLQGAADAAAYSAGIAFRKSTSIVTQAKGITAAHRYVDGQNGVVVSVNQPPTLGNYTSNASAIEVIIQQPQPRYFAVLFLSSNPTVKARAVAILSGSACILALNPTANQAIDVSGSADIEAPGCSVIANSTSNSAVNMTGSAKIRTPCLVAVGNVKVTSGLQLTKCKNPTIGAAATADPYASVPAPTASGPCLTVPSDSNVTLSPGHYCDGLTVNSSATFNPGVYYVDGNFAIQGSATASGTAVTFYLTGTNTAISGSATVNFTAPPNGIYSGILFFGARTVTNGNNAISGGTNSNLTGAIYFPTQNVTFSGGSSSGSNCTQIVAGTITVSGQADFGSSCNGDGMGNIAGNVQLVE